MIHLCCEGFVDFHNLQDLSLGMLLAGVMHDTDNTYSIQSTWLGYRWALLVTVAYNGKHHILVLLLIGLLLSFVSSGLYVEYRIILCC